MKILVEAGNIGSDKSKIEIDGLIIKCEVRLMINFSMNYTLGFVLPFKEKGKIYIDTNLCDDYSNLYPAIGYKSLKASHINDIVIVLESEIMCISLNSNPNNDETIKSIGEQLNGK